MLNNKWLALAGFFVACFAVAAIGGLTTAQSLADWYPTLRQPSWQPPSWLFGPVWTVLYAMMAVAAWLVWQKGDSKTAMFLFFGQLALNLAWPILFFGAHSPGLALMNIGMLWLAIAATIFAFAMKSRTAAFMMVPYIMWVSFASALNAAIWMLN